MFLAVIMGYVVAAVFLFCGIANVIIYMQGIQQTMTATAFVNGLALAMWPLAIAAAVFLLTQIAILLERQCIVAENPAIAPAPVPATSSQVRTKGKKSTGLSNLPLPDPPRQDFPQGKPAPAATTLPARPSSSSLREAAAAAAMAAAAAASAPGSPTPTRPASVNDDDKEQEDLTFFRLD